MRFNNQTKDFENKFIQYMSTVIRNNRLKEMDSSAPLEEVDESALGDIYIDYLEATSAFHKYCKKFKIFPSLVKLETVGEETIYPCDLEPMSYKAKQYQLTLGTYGKNHTVFLGTNLDKVNILELLFDTKTGNFSKLIINNPYLYDYILMAYQNTQMKKLETEKAQLIKQMIEAKKTVETRKQQIKDINKQLPITKQISSIFKK